MLSLLYGPTLTSLHDCCIKTKALTMWAFVRKVICLLFNMLSRFVIAFFPMSKRLLISWLQSPSTMILEPKKIESVTASTLLKTKKAKRNKKQTETLPTYPNLGETLSTFSGIAQCLGWVSLMLCYKSSNSKTSFLGNSISDKLIMWCFAWPMRFPITYSPTVIYNMMTTRNLSRSQEQQE